MIYKSVLRRKAINWFRSISAIATLVIVGGFVFVMAVSHAMDSSFDNRDVMLCNSAKVSGNEQYLEKCGCFYAGEEIRCIYKENK